MTGSGFCKVLAGESDRAKEPAAFSSEALQLVSECEGHVPPRRGGDGRGLRRGLAGGPLGVSQRGAAGREGFVCGPDAGVATPPGVRMGGPVRRAVLLAKAARAQRSGSRALFSEWPLACQTLRPGATETPT